jgi:NAD(P)-dependent dehydrogenase (short-subunit alcohol dehydrogenase family)
MQLKDKVILVTGGSKGIGLGICQFLVASGAKVILTSRTKVSADQAADKIRKECPGSTIFGLPFDMDDSTSMAGLIDSAVKVHGKLDALINNAVSKSLLVPVTSGEDAAIEASITSNISGVIKLCKYAHPHLKQSRGSIINIASSITRRYISGLPLYAVAKTAIVRLTEVLAADWAVDGVRLNAINPGFTKSSAFADMGFPAEAIDKAYHYFESFQPLGIADPGDIAPLVGFLISEHGAMITGAVFDVDGGHHVQGHPAMPPA